MNIIICDDHALVAESLRALFESCGHDVLALLDSPDRIAGAVAHENVDLCVLDLQFPSGSSLGHIPGLLVAAPTLKIAVLTGVRHAGLRAGALAAGAHAFLVKDGDATSLVASLERLVEGRLAPVASVSYLSYRPPSQSAQVAATLGRYITGREREVLEGLVRGESTMVLASQLGIRPSTVRSHVQNLLDKFGVHSRVAAVSFAVRHSLVSMPGPDLALVSGVD